MKIPRRMQREEGSGINNVVYKLLSLLPSCARRDLILKGIPNTWRAALRERPFPTTHVPLVHEGQLQATLQRLLQHSRH